VHVCGGGTHPAVIGNSWHQERKQRETTVVFNTQLVQMCVLSKGWTQTVIANGPHCGEEVAPATSCETYMGKS